MTVPSPPPHFVVNARCTSALASRRLAALREAVARAFPGAPWRATERPGHAVDLARGAAAAGARLVVAVGGDGTINEVVNGILSAPGTPPVLGILPAGTGSDFIRTIRLPRRVSAALEVLSSGRDCRVDVGEIECAALAETSSRRGPGDGEASGGTRETAVGDADTRPLVRRYFLNIAGCGASGRVVELFNQRRMRGAWGYGVAAAMAAWDYRWPLVELAVDAEAARPLHLNVLFVCNGEFCGGGMHVGRGARLDDGLLQIVEAANVGRVGALLQWPVLYTGWLARVSGVRVVGARVVRATSREHVLVDADGELCGCLPATYRIVPGALTVRMP